MHPAAEAPKEWETGSRVATGEWQRGRSRSSNFKTRCDTVFIYDPVFYSATARRLEGPTSLTMEMPFA